MAKKNKLDACPKFEEMNDIYAQNYILEYIKTRFTINGRLIAKLPGQYREDAIQMIFIDLWEHRYNYNPDKAAFSTYAYYRGMHIVRKIYNTIRKHNINEKYEKINKKLNIKHVFLQEENSHEFLQKVFGLMAPLEKKIISMYIFDNLKFSEIASKLDITGAKVRIIIKKVQRLSKHQFVKDAWAR